MMKCKNGHDMDAAHKRCGECGGEPAGELAKSVTCTCGAAATGNFCTDCGEPLAKAELGAAELESALDTLDTLAKANANLGADLTINDDDPLPELAELEATFAKSVDPNEPVDAAPILHATVSGLSTVYSHERAIGGELRTARREIGIMAKAYADGLRGIQLMVKSVGDKFEAFANQRRPARSVHQVTPHDKSLAPKPAGAVETETEIGGHELMAKCQVAFQKGHITRQDLMQTETFVGLISSKGGPQHAHLGTIRNEDPALASRLERGIAAITQ